MSRQVGQATSATAVLPCQQSFRSTDGGRSTVGVVSSFLYVHTGNLEAARHFYTTLLGLSEIYHSKTEPTVGYKIGTLQLTIAAHPEAATVPHWSKQLGWAGGTSARTSWGFELDGERFGQVV